MEYRARRTSGASGTIAVPTEVMKMIPEEARFTCELTEEGILYRVRLAEEPGLPSWVRREDEPSCRSGG